MTQAQNETTQRECEKYLDRCFASSLSMTVTALGHSITTHQEVFGCINSSACDTWCQLFKENIPEGTGVTVKSCNVSLHRLSRLEINFKHKETLFSLLYLLIKNFISILISWFLFVKRADFVLRMHEMIQVKIVNIIYF